MDICQGKNVHLVGIKGAGMAGLAQILKGLGYRISGSDISDTFFTDDILKREGIKFHEGFDAQNIPQRLDWAVSSGAYLVKKSKVKSQKSKIQIKNKKNYENSEIQELQKRGVPMITYPEALAYFFNQCYGIAVTGTHGKSTTAAMIAYILEQAGKDPFALVGGELLNWHSNARVPQKATNYKLQATSCFVIEADEYREQFLYYKPQMIVITNIDYDHPDYFTTKKAYQAAFEKFKGNLKPKGFIIENASKNLQATSYKLQAIGVHNQQNAALAYEVCARMGIDDAMMRKVLASFEGTRRRLEQIGEYNGAVIFDDYAHHPAEIKASLSALKETYPHKRLIVLFHPHTYSRTKTFLKEFASSLILADAIYLLDVYASMRENDGEVSSDDIVREIRALGRNANNLKNLKNALQYMKGHLARGDLLVTMGAGDVFRVAWQLVKLKVKNEK